MADENNEIEVIPGSPEFEQMLFKINGEVNDDNLTVFNFGGNQLQEVQPDMYAMPAYIEDDFNLFFIVAPLVENDWVIAFSTAEIENGNKITDLSEPMTTGEGLNSMGEVSPESANQLLQYFNTLVDAKRGEWRMIEKNQNPNTEE
ncbi:hypothetical protein OXT66_04225 [Lentilactobacillus senioris]|uniref:hypothetical protein n=1 Tax=Lentilactobacillus senioris TaxID=931534 RepID=UPI0022807CAA|nr:hypothetical protein [Lentilactobacillus senioris]MCY9806753.1 hypothetical protein [Lentilactobacillus senioris]